MSSTRGHASSPDDAQIAREELIRHEAMNELFAFIPPEARADALLCYTEAEQAAVNAAYLRKVREQATPAPERRLGFRPPVKEPAPTEVPQDDALDVTEP